MGDWSRQEYGWGPVAAQLTNRPILQSTSNQLAFFLLCLLVS
jgi:hypothetical protein